MSEAKDLLPPAPDLERFLSCQHTDPHSILGAHLTSDGVVVRAWRPACAAMTLLGNEGEVWAMVRHSGTDLFQVLVEDRHELFSYWLEAELTDGRRLRCRDPYSFSPSMGELDVHLFAEGRHQRLHEVMGAHRRALDGVSGTAFSMWAPNTVYVSVVGDFNAWNDRAHPMRLLGGSGIWELFVPEVEEGAHYKYCVRLRDQTSRLKADPYACALEVPPATASIVYSSRYRFTDSRWMAERAESDARTRPMSIYEVHLGSWRRHADGAMLTYRELAGELADYVSEMGFTHVELMPVMEHPFSGSWGYQISGYFAPSSRQGSPDDFRFLIDHLHRRGIGVLLDWVPGHFPTDEFCLGRFDGTALYEHLDPRLGFHPDWKTYILNYGRPQVRNFLLSSALCWLRDFHADGLRVDAVASMLYLDYSRREGEWIPNVYGGRENLEAIRFLRELNQFVSRLCPGVLMVAEESTDWPGVSRPVDEDGLGFQFKWDMGWMHDTVHYFSADPLMREGRHRDLTFGMLYAWSENFIMPLSHDEVVHGKGSLIGKMPGTRSEQFANLRALFAYTWARPSKKLVFMGGEFGQRREWNFDDALDWRLLEREGHAGLKRLVRDLNETYRREPALWEDDHRPEGFNWIDADNASDNVIAFMRTAQDRERALLCVCNFSGAPHPAYRIGVPKPGFYAELLNTDSAYYGGGNRGNRGGMKADAHPWQGFPYSLSLNLAPLSVVWFLVPGRETEQQAI